MDVSFSCDSPTGMALWMPFASGKGAGRQREKRAIAAEVFSFASAGRARHDAVSRRHVPGHRRVLPETPTPGRYLAEGPDPLRIGCEGFYMAARSPDGGSALPAPPHGFGDRDGLTLDWEMAPMLGAAPVAGAGIAVRPRHADCARGGAQGTVLVRQLEAHCNELREALWASFDAAGDPDGEAWVDAWSESEQEVVDQIVSSAWGASEGLWGSNRVACDSMVGLLSELSADRIERFGLIARVMLRALQRDAGAKWVDAYDQPEEQQPDGGAAAYRPTRPTAAQEARALAVGEGGVRLMRGVGLLHVLAEVARRGLPGTPWEGGPLPEGSSWPRLGLRTSLLLRMAAALQAMGEWETGACVEKGRGL